MSALALSVTFAVKPREGTPSLAPRVEAHDHQRHVVAPGPVEARVAEVLAERLVEVLADARDELRGARLAVLQVQALADVRGDLDKQQGAREVKNL